MADYIGWLVTLVSAILNLMLLLQRLLDILKGECPLCNRRYKSHSVFFVGISRVMGWLRAGHNRGGAQGLGNVSKTPRGGSLKFAAEGCKNLTPS